MRYALLFSLFFHFQSILKLTITSDDISSVFTKGNITTVHDLAANTSIDIGSRGGGNKWDFTSLQANETYDLISIDKSEAPHSAEFLNADIVTYEKAASDKCQLELGLF